MGVCFCGFWSKILAIWVMGLVALPPLSCEAIISQMESRNRCIRWRGTEKAYLILLLDLEPFNLCTPFALAPNIGMVRKRIIVSSSFL